MNLKKVLTQESVLMPVTEDTKQGVIEEMVDFLAGSGKIHNREAALQAVLAREAKMSTGMQHGIAIPHGKTDSVDQLIVAVAISPKDIDFDAMDGNPSRIFIMTLSPENRTGPHIQFLAEISKVLGDETLRDQLVAATDPGQVLALLTT